MKDFLDKVTANSILILCLVCLVVLMVFCPVPSANIELIKTIITALISFGSGMIINK